MDKSLKTEPLVTLRVVDQDILHRIEAIIEASVWSATPVADQPEIELARWQVMQLPNGDRHFVGWNATEGEGRASSKIVEFDPLTRRGRTTSGRVYQLRGQTGHDGDGSHTWGRWMRNNGAVAFEDVSAAVQARIDAIAAAHALDQPMGLAQEGST